MSNRNKFIVGFNGVDNTGKSTLVSLLKNYLVELDGDMAYIPPHFSKLTAHFPKEETEVIQWLKNTPSQEIVRKNKS